MGQLDAGARALRVNELRDAGEGGDVVVLPDAEIARRDAAFRSDGGGFQRDQAGAALRACAEMDKMPIGGEAVLRGVLAHGRDADAIGDREGAELKRREEWMAHCVLDERERLGMQWRAFRSLRMARGVVVSQISDKRPRVPGCIGLGSARLKLS